jgi:ABC-type glycerol-3-phosphate transport system substrate-binding protein
MRSFLLSVFGGLAVLSLGAVLLVPPGPPPGVTPLLWASSANPFRLAQIQRFNQLHPTLQVRLDSSNNRFEKIIVQNSSGVGPDFFDVLTGSYLQAYVESGVAWDLTAEARSHGIAADLDTWPGIHNEITYDGRQYGYPANVGTFLILYNKNIFDRFGVAYPGEEVSMTWPEFTALLQRVSGPPPGGGRPVWGTNAVDYSGRAPAPYYWKTLFYSQHGEYFSADGTHPTIDTEVLRTAFQMHKDAIFRDRVMPGTVDLGTMTGAGGWGNGAITQFAEGHFATIVSGKFALASLRGFVEEQKRLLARWLADPERQRNEPRPEVLRIGVFPLPHFPGRPQCGVALSQTVVINPGSAHHEQSLAFLHFLASDTYARMVEVYGMPGNPRLVSYNYPISHPELAEHAITRCVAQMMQYGYQTRKSPFLLDFDVDRVLNEQALRLEANPALDVHTALAGAQRELEELLQLNLRRDPRLAALYRQRQLATSRATAAAP